MGLPVVSDTSVASPSLTTLPYHSDVQVQIVFSVLTKATQINLRHAQFIDFFPRSC